MNTHRATRHLEKPAKTRCEHDDTDWPRHLPDGWQDAVQAPLYFHQYSEYEIRADRTVGYDADDQPCFTAHRVELTRVASDDDEEFYEVVSYQEEMAAWRLRDERWLVFRIVSTSHCNPPRGFYAFSQRMPR
jgi:hypothetical protein